MGTRDDPSDRADTAGDERANAASVPIFVLFVDERDGKITLDFVLAEAGRRSDGSVIEAGLPFAASFRPAVREELTTTLRTLRRWAARSRSVRAMSGIDAAARHLLVLCQDDDDDVVLEYS